MSQPDVQEERSATAQLVTARTILAMGEEQLRQHAETGAHADRLDQLHALRDTWTARIAHLEPQAAAEAKAREQGKAFGL